MARRIGVDVASFVCLDVEARTDDLNKSFVPWWNYLIVVPKNLFLYLVY